MNNFDNKIIHTAIDHSESRCGSRIAEKSVIMFLKLSDQMTPLRKAVLGVSGFSARNGEWQKCLYTQVKLNCWRSERCCSWFNLSNASTLLPIEVLLAEWDTRALKALFGMLRLSHPVSFVKR